MSAAANGQVIPVAEQSRALRQFLDAKTVIGELTKVLPKKLTPERLIRQTLTLANKNPDLLACSQVSILAGMIQAAELGLELSGPLGQAYLVPRWNSGKRCKEATFQVGYRGLLNLAFRSGKIQAMPMREVYEKDSFSVSYGSYGNIRHEPEIKGERGNVTGFYAVANLSGGGMDFEFMTLPEALAFRARFAAKNSIWDSNFNEMALKTCCRKLCKRLPVSVELQNAAVLDEYHEQGHFSHHGESPLLGPSRTEALADRLGYEDDQGDEGVEGAAQGPAHSTAESES